MSDMTPRDHGLSFTPRNAFLLGAAAGIAVGQASLVALMNLPDQVLDTGVRLLNWLQRRT